MKQRFHKAWSLVAKDARLRYRRLNQLEGAPRARLAAIAARLTRVHPLHPNVNSSQGEPIPKVVTVQLGTPWGNGPNAAPFANRSKRRTDGYFRPRPYV